MDKPNFIKIAMQSIGDTITFILTGRERSVGYVAKRGGPIKINTEEVEEVRINGKRAWRK